MVQPVKMTQTMMAMNNSASGSPGLFAPGKPVSLQGVTGDLLLWAKENAVSVMRLRGGLPWLAYIGREDDLALYPERMAAYHLAVASRRKADAVARIREVVRESGMDTASILRLLRGQGKCREYAVVIDHPSSKLGPNGRLNHLYLTEPKNRVKEETRRECVLLGIPLEFRPVVYDVTWYYVGNMPDDDNVIARCKYARDAVARYLGMDDRHICIGRMKRVYSKEFKGRVMLNFREEVEA